MFFLKIRKPTGDVEVRPLTKSQPLSVGQHPSNDICIDEEGVPRLHCRIAWSKDTYEVAAATSEPVLINGTAVRKWKLSPQDVVRVGGAELRLVYKKDKEDAKEDRGSEKKQPPTAAEKPRKPDKEEIGQEDLGLREMGSIPVKPIVEKPIQPPVVKAPESSDDAPLRMLGDDAVKPVRKEPAKPVREAPPSAKPSRAESPKPLREEPPRHVPLAEPARPVEEPPKPLRGEPPRPLREQPSKPSRRDAPTLKPVREEPIQPEREEPLKPLPGFAPPHPTEDLVDSRPPLWEPEEEEEQEEGPDLGESLEFLLARDEEDRERPEDEELGLAPEPEEEGRTRAQKERRESISERERAPVKEPPRVAVPPADEDEEPADLLEEEEEEAEEEEEVEREEIEPEERPARRPARRAATPETQPSGTGSLLAKFGRGEVRPGEEDVLRSPFVLTLSIGAVVLLLAAATFWFIIGRQAVQQQLDAAHTEYEQGHFTQSIALFEDFLMKHPRHGAVPEVMLTLGKAQIEKEILGATPSWKNGLSALEDFIDRQRDDEQRFQELSDTLTRYGRDIALGSLKAAASVKNRELLDVSSAAALIFERYAPTDPPPVEFRQQLKEARELAEQAILKHETFQAALSEMKTALKANRPLEALVARRQLLARYPDLLADKSLVDALQQIRETARQLVVREDLDRAAQTTERDDSGRRTPSLTLAVQSRALSGETSDGQAIFALANGCCFGIDRVTGDPLWRRVVGLDSPFFPVPVQTSQVMGLLLYDTRVRELVLVDRNTGRLVWRQPLEEEAVGSPLVHEGQLYQVTQGGHLYSLELETGRATARLTFCQPLQASPVLVSGGTHLAVSGDEAILYSLTLRPLACQSVSLLEHKPGALASPPLAMGSLILIAENDSLESSVLRVIDGRDPDRGLVEIESARAKLDGPVHDTPVLRGNALFVPVAGEQVAAFTVSDEPNQNPLTLAGRHAIKTSHPGSLFLSAGPDGQMWMAGSALRRFQLKTNNISLDPNLIAEGMTTQPLQAYGQYLFHARRRPHSRAVWFVKIDREAQPSMTSLWRTVLGARMLVVSSSEAGSLVCLSEEGELFHLGEQELRDGGFRTRSDGQLQLPENLTEPLRAVVLADGQIAVYCGAPGPKLWLLNPQGQVKQEMSPEAPLQHDPVLLAGGLVLPVAQRLEFRPLKPGQPRVEGFTLPVENQENVPRWTGVVAVSQDEMIVTNSRAQVVKIQYRTAPVPHLFEGAKLAMDQSIDVPPVVAKDRVFVADATGHLRMLHTSNLEPLAEIQLDAPVSGPLNVVANRLFVEVGRSQLVCFAIDATLSKQWSVPLEGGGLSDRPIETPSGLVFGERSGRINRMSLEKGEILSRTSIEQPIDLGPRPIGSAFLVCSIDGALHRVELEPQATK